MTSIFTRSDPLDGITNEVKAETDQSVQSVELIRHPTSDAYRTEDPDREVRHGFDFNNHPTQKLVDLEEPIKRIQLHRRQPSIPAGNDDGPNYGLQDASPTVTENMDLKIASVAGGCIETGNDASTEAGRSDEESLDISCLSLGIDPKQITIFRRRSQDE